MMLKKKKDENKRLPKIKLWLLIRGFTKRAFKKLVVNGAETIAQEIFKDYAKVYEEMHGEQPTEKMFDSMNKCQSDFVEFVKSHKAKEILIEAKEYFIKG